MARFSLLKRNRIIVSGLLLAAISSGCFISEASARNKAKDLKEAGDFLYYHGDVDEAILKFEEAIELDPEMVDAHMSLVNLYLMRKKKDKAIDHAKAVVRLKPDKASGHMLLGNLLRSEGKYADAAAELEKALERGSPEGIVCNALGYSYLQTKEFQKALDRFELAKKHRAVEQDAIMGGAIAKYRMGRKNDAIKDLDSAIDRFGAFGGVHQTKGHLLVGMGKLKDATAAYEMAVKTNPRNFKTFEALGNTYYKLGQSDKAEKAFQSSVKLNQNNASAHYALGLIHQKKKNYAKAAEHFANGSYVEKNNKLRNKMLRHSMILKKKAGLNVGSFNISADTSSVPSMIMAPKNKFFDMSYSDLVGKQDDKWKEFGQKVKNAKVKPTTKSKRKKKKIFKINKPHMVPGRIH